MDDRAAMCAGDGPRLAGASRDLDDAQAAFAGWVSILIRAELRLARAGRHGGGEAA